MIRWTALFFALLFSTITHASVFVHSKGNKRNYIQVTNLAEKTKLTTYSQIRGEDAYIVDVNYLDSKDLSSQIDEITKTYQFQKKLDNWALADKDFKAFFFPWGKKAKPIWTAKNQWSNNWEEKFGQWIENEVDVEFFKRYNLATDCADAVVGLRWIFARIHSLPVANTVNNSTSLFGNFTVRKDWKKLSTAKDWNEDELFKTALEYVMDMSTTRTLTKDGYPVSLDKNGLKVGTFIVTQNVGGGHVSIVNSANWDDDTKAPLVVLASTLPRKVRDLKEEIYMEEDWPEKGQKDILAFKWPEVKNGEWKLITPASGAYSLEQYDKELKVSQPNFIKYLLENIKGNFNPNYIVQKMMDDLYSYVELRIDVAKSGLEHCSKSPCLENSINFDYWSTFNRDAKIISKFNVIESMIGQYSKLDEGLTRSWNRFLSERFLVIEGVEVSFESLKTIFQKGEYSSNPNDSILKRWGLNFQEKIDSFSLEIKSLFAKRMNTLQNQDQNCDETCVPGNIKWLAYSTYPEDKLLNQLYIKLIPLCQGANEPLCRSVLKEEVEINQTKVSYFDLVKQIPFFNSDPRAPLDLRWGAPREGVKTSLLPSFDVITIAQNKMALLDNSWLINLETKETIYKAKSNEKLYLSANGAVFLKEGNLNLYLFLNDQKIAISDVASHAFELEVISFGKKDYLKILSDDICLYEVANSSAKLVACKIKSLSQQNNAFYAVTESNILFLNNSNVQEINLNQLANHRLNVEFLKIVDAKNDQLILTYESKDEDRYEIYQISNQELRKINISNFNKIKLKKSYLKDGILFFINEFNAEYPQSYLYDLKNSELIKIYNDVAEFNENDSSIFYASLEGSQWESRKIKRLFKWDRKTRFNEEVGVFDQIKSQNEFLYLSKESNGEILLVNEQKIFLQSKSLATDYGCKGIIGNGENFVYLFDYLYGDNLCNGGVYSKKTLELSSRNYPIFTTYSWFNQDNLKDSIWFSNKENQKIYRGQINFFGPENAFWFQESM